LICRSGRPCPISRASARILKLDLDLPCHRDGLRKALAKGGAGRLAGVLADHRNPSAANAASSALSLTGCAPAFPFRAARLPRPCHSRSARITTDIADFGELVRSPLTNGASAACQPPADFVLPHPVEPIIRFYFGLTSSRSFQHAASASVAHRNRNRRAWLLSATISRRGRRTIALWGQILVHIASG